MKQIFCVLGGRVLLVLSEFFAAQANVFKRPVKASKGIPLWLNAMLVPGVSHQLSGATSFPASLSYRVGAGD